MSALCDIIWGLLLLPSDFFQTFFLRCRVSKNKKNLAAYEQNTVYFKVDTADLASRKLPNVLILNHQFLCLQIQLGWCRSLTFQNWPSIAESMNSSLLDPLIPVLTIPRLRWNVSVESDGERLRRDELSVGINSLWPHLRGLMKAHTVHELRPVRCYLCGFCGSAGTQRQRQSRPRNLLLLSVLWMTHCSADVM